MDKRVTKGQDTRRRHSDALKRELVERSLEPGALVAAIAQEASVNANLLFNISKGLRVANAAPSRASFLDTCLLPTVAPIR
jgi:transposase